MWCSFFFFPFFMALFCRKKWGKWWVGSLYNRREILGGEGVCWIVCWKKKKKVKKEWGLLPFCYSLFHFLWVLTFLFSFVACVFFSSLWCGVAKRHDIFLPCTSCFHRHLSNNITIYTPLLSSPLLSSPSILWYALYMVLLLFYLYLYFFLTNQVSLTWYLVSYINNNNPKEHKIQYVYINFRQYSIFTPLTMI